MAARQSPRVGHAPKDGPDSQKDVVGSYAIFIKLETTQLTRSQISASKAARNVKIKSKK